MSKLGEITINGKQVAVFKPPHDEPDFPWVDVEQLANVFMPADAAKMIVDGTRRFDGDNRAYSTVRSGDRIAIIVCHAMAQGLCGAIDNWNDHAGETEDGPAHHAYCIALGVFAAANWPMSFEDIFHAFKNPGGKFMSSIRSREAE